MTGKRVESPGGASHPTLLAGGGVLASLGASSCCALPVLLASGGLGASWLSGVAAVAAPIRLPLLLMAVALTASGAVSLWRAWRRRQAACEAGVPCRRPAALWLATVLTTGAAGFLMLTLTIA